MKRMVVLLAFTLLFGLKMQAQTDNYSQTAQIDKNSEQLTEIARSLNLLNEKLKTFSETFSSNQGLRLSERQQTILIAFEFLNRAEQRRATLQKLRIDLSEKQSSIRTKLAEVEDNLRSEAIDRTLTGTTNAEEVRNIRRRFLNREKADLSALLNEIENMIRETDSEIKDNENFLRRVRVRIFPAIDKEITDL